MPLTPAEKQRRYRERLKQNRPQKFDAMKKENAVRMKRNRKRVAECNEEEANQMRKQWREAKKRKLNESESKLLDNPKITFQTEESENIESKSKTVTKDAQEDFNEKGKQTIEKQLDKKTHKSIYNAIKYENSKLNEQLLLSKKRIKVLQKKLNRYKLKIKSLEEYINELQNKNKDKIDTANHNQGEMTSINQEEMTPNSKTNSFIQANLPHIPAAKKESVKRKILEHNVLVSAIKSKYKEAPTDEKKLLKGVMDSDTVKKYKLKSRFSGYLGLKGNIRKTSHIIKKRRQHLLRSLHDYYVRDDVSRITAGKKEYKTFKKCQKQRRYLLQPLKKLYEKYKAEGGVLSYTTFKKHRPFYVLPPKINNRDTCACSKHENLDIKLKKLYQLNLTDKNCLDDLIPEVMCDKKSKTCAYNECKLCQDKSVKFGLKKVNLDEVIYWNEWAIINKEYHDKKSNSVKKTKRMVKQSKMGTVKQLISCFTADFIAFKKHWYNIIHQYKMHQYCLSSLDDESVAILVDFSENYYCKLGTEVQAMHFGASKVQITLHTGVLYTNSGKIPEKQTFATISPNTYHGPEAIWAHLEPILNLIKEKYPAVTALHFFSDGPTSQYRNKKNFYLFMETTKKCGFPHSTWNFSEASHGKGPADGVGGAIKRCLDTNVAYGVDIPDALTAYNVLSQSELKIKLFYIPETMIKEKNYDLRPITGTMAIHQIRNTPMKNCIAYRELSCFCTIPIGYCDCFGINQQNLVATGSRRKEKKDIKPKKQLPSKKNVTEDSDYDSTESFSVHDSSGEGNLEQWREEMQTKDNDDDKMEIVNVDTEFENMRKKIRVGSFVIFKYEGRPYPGLIISMNDEGVLISAMEKSLKSWRWPTKADELLYCYEDIILEINPPKQISKRGFYMVPEIDKYM